MTVPAEDKPEQTEIRPSLCNHQYRKQLQTDCHEVEVGSTTQFDRREHGMGFGELQGEKRSRATELSSALRWGCRLTWPNVGLTRPRSIAPGRNA